MAYIWLVGGHCIIIMTGVKGHLVNWTTLNTLPSYIEIISLIYSPNSNTQNCNIFLSELEFRYKLLYTVEFDPAYDIIKNTPHVYNETPGDRIV